MSGRIGRWLPVGAWAALVLCLASVNVFPQNHEYSRMVLRKAAHLGVYAVLACLLYRALARDGRRPGLRGMLLVLGLTAALACSDEWRQSFVPGRSARVADVELDMVGGTIGIFGAWLFGAIRGRSAARSEAAKFVRS